MQPVSMVVGERYVPHTPDATTLLSVCVARGITQERLAEMAELNLRTIQKIEAGDINIMLTTVVRIQNALACPCTKLLREK